MADVVIAARLVLALVFATAALAKLRDLDAVAGTIRGLGFGRHTARALAPLLVASEALAAFFVLSGVSPLLAAALVGILLAAFTAAALTALAGGRTVQCSCFGADSGVLGMSTMVRCALLAVPAGVSALPVTADGVSSDRLAATTLVGALALGSLLAGKWLLALPILARLMRERRLATVAGADRAVS